jgi:hypothetical protein
MEVKVCGVDGMIGLKYLKEGYEDLGGFKEQALTAH